MYFGELAVQAIKMIFSVKQVGQAGVVSRELRNIKQAKK